MADERKEGLCPATGVVEADVTGTRVVVTRPSSPSSIKYTCRRCRTVLFTGADTASHEQGQQSFSHHRLSKAKRGAVAVDEFGFPDPVAAAEAKAALQRCDSFFLAESLPWMGLEEGRLLCPNSACGARIGTLKWAGSQCSCMYAACVALLAAGCLGCNNSIRRWHVGYSGVPAAEISRGLSDTQHGSGRSRDGTCEQRGAHDWGGTCEQRGTCDRHVTCQQHGTSRQRVACQQPGACSQRGTFRPRKRWRCWICVTRTVPVCCQCQLSFRLYSSSCRRL